MVFTTFAQGQAVLKVMPLGDSITRGSNGAGAIPGGYRKQLGIRIAGFGRSYDFVGNRSDNAAPGMDPHHNGRDGWRTDQVLGALTNDLKANPDVVIMHLGTNDLIQAVPTATAITNMTTLIQRITSHGSAPRLYVATIIPIMSDRDGKTKAQWAVIINDYNSKVRLLVQQQAGLGRKVNLVDMAAGLNFTMGTAATNFYHPTDGTHPNQNGYDRMGDFWFNALQAGGSLGTSPPPPPPPPPSNTAFVNGSFEDGYTGWAFSGNQAIRTHSSFLPPDGQSVVVFNSGNSTPNGILSQTFPTTAGVSYSVAFHVGVLSYNSSQQKIEVRATGAGTLLSQTLTRTGFGNGVPRWTSHTHAFVANSGTTTLAFFDRSTATNALDLLLDNVRVTGGSPPVHTAPTANPDNYSTLAGTPLTVPAPGVLGNDTASQSNALTAALVTGVSKGSLSFNANGSFVYQPAAGFVGTDSFTYKANDGNLDSATATVSITVRAEAVAGLVNGSFESDLAGWTASGAVDVKSAGGYVPTHGGKLLAFNSANQAPDGLISQTFATTAGETYQLRFDLGVLSYNTHYQKMGVSVTGSGALLSRTITLRGAGGGSTRWFPQSFTFVADGGSATLTFRDQSTTTNSLDLLLDNVRVSSATADPLVVAPEPVLAAKVSMSGTPGNLEFQMAAAEAGTYFLERSPDLKNWFRVSGSEQTVTEPAMLSFKDLEATSDENTGMFYRVGLVR